MAGIPQVLRARRAHQIRAKAIAAARAEIGVKETPPGSNDGQRIREYQRTTGAMRAAWCASFVTWAYRQAGVELDTPNRAYCPSFDRSSRGSSRNLRAVTARQVIPGDLALFDWQDDRVADHIAIVTSKVSGGTFTTIEGNTSTGTAGSQSNGGCVAARKRNASDVCTFVRVIP